MSTTRRVPALGALALVAASLFLGGLRRGRRGGAGGGRNFEQAGHHSERGRQAVAPLRPQVGAGRPCDRRADEHGQGVSRGPAHSPRPRPHARRGVEGNRRRRGTQPRLDPPRRRHRPRTVAWLELGDATVGSGQLHGLRRHRTQAKQRRTVSAPRLAAAPPTAAARSRLTQRSPSNDNCQPAPGSALRAQRPFGARSVGTRARRRTR
jgi:hypothetical protein